MHKLQIHPHEIRIKKHISLIILFTLLVLVIIYLQADKKDELIMTPSTHQQITFLKVENARFDSNYSVPFCLYDKECNSVQICISAPPKDRTLLQANIMTFFVDDKKVPDYTLITVTSWKNKYIMILLDNITEFQSIRCEYGSKIFTAYNT